MAVRHGIKTKPDDEFVAPATIKQRAARARYNMFSHHYVNNGFNATQAALSTGYSPASAATQGNDLLEIPYVKERIEVLLDEAQKASVVTRDWLITKLQENMDRCVENKDQSAYNGAVKLLKELQGFDPPSKIINVHQVSDNDERDARLVQALEKYESPR